MLELLRERRPVGAHRFQPFKDHALAVPFLNQPGVAFFAAHLRATNGRHQKTAEVSFVLQLQRTLKAHTLFKVTLPPGVNVCNQPLAYLCGLVFFMRPFKPDERGVGIAVNHRIALRFDQRFGLTHDLVAAHGDRGGEARIVEPARAGAEHAVKRVHDDFQRLRERLVAEAFSLFAPLPDLRDDLRQAVRLA